MKALTSKSMFVLVLALLLTMTAAAQAPRVVPENDDFAAARTLKPGKSYTVSDAGAATEEVDEPGACSLSTYNTVWFEFTPEVSSTLYLSTAGTVLTAPLANTYDTLLAVYTGADLATLTSEACNDDSGSYSSEVVYDFTAGTTYYIQVGTYDEIDFEETSFYRLTSRVLYADLTPENADFEDPLTDNWTLNGGSDDEVVCGDVDYPAGQASCALKLVGGVDENTKVKQTLDLPASFKLRQDGTIYVAVLARGLDSATIGQAKLVATLVYKDGTPSNKVVLNFTGFTAEPDYNWASGFAFLNSKKLSQVKVKIVWKADEGTLLIDDVYLEYGSGSHVRTEGGLLPLPQAPQ